MKNEAGSFYTTSKKVMTGETCLSHNRAGGLLFNKSITNTAKWRGGGGGAGQSVYICIVHMYVQQNTIYNARMIDARAQRYICINMQLRKKCLQQTAPTIYAHKMYGITTSSTSPSN